MLGVGGARQAGFRMRFELVVIAIIVAALGIDAFYFDSRYATAAATMLLDIARRMLPN